MIIYIHGDYINLLYQITRREITNAIFIQEGNFGLGFHDPGYDIQTLTGLNNFLIKSKNTLYIARGNHDNPFFRTHCEELQFTNIFFVENDGEIEEKITGKIHRPAMRAMSD